MKYPCTDCITLGICKASKSFGEVISKCQLLRDYLGHKGNQPMLDIKIQIAKKDLGFYKYIIDLNSLKPHG